MKKILELLYPSCCPICDEIWHGKDHHCCPKCREKLPWITGAVCMKCGKPVGKEQEFCWDCQRQKHYFDQGAAVFLYDLGLPDAIYRMKYRNRRDSVEFFAEAIWSVCGKKIRHWNPQAIVPVPMYWRKERRRGYNQSLLLAEKLSILTGIPVKKKLLRCMRMTSAQKTLNRRERQENLKGIFQIHQMDHPLKRVLIVDDVYTTGSTMDEIAKVLRKVGIQKVFFVVLCTGKGKMTVCTEENL